MTLGPRLAKSLPVFLGFLFFAKTLPVFLVLLFLDNLTPRSRPASTPRNPFGHGDAFQRHKVVGVGRRESTGSAEIPSLIA